MLLSALLLAAPVPPVRPELVEGRPPLERVGRPSTGLGRTGREAPALRIRAALLAQLLPGEGRAPAQGSGTGPRLPPGKGAHLRTREPRTALDAERAFAADAQAMGQWAAFRKWAAADSVIFVPRPTNAQAWLKGRASPAKSVEWWPTESYVSCDGGTAVNTGGWKRPDGSVGYLTTVWQRQADGGWRWVVDSGDALKAAPAQPALPRVVRASCSAPPREPPEAIDPTHGAGSSLDRTLLWGWALNATGHTRVVDATIWNGTRYVDAFEDLITVE